MSIKSNLPDRRYFTRQEAAKWFGLSVDTFDNLRIPFVDFGPRNHRWDVFDLVAFAEQNKSCDSAQASASQKGRQTCVSTNAKVHKIGGPTGTTRTESDFAEVLELPTVS